MWIRDPGRRAPNQLIGDVALRRPIVVVEQDRRGVDAKVDRYVERRIGSDQALDFGGNRGDTRMPRLAEQQRDQVRRINAQRIVRRVERWRRAEMPVEDTDPAVERREIRPFEIVTINGVRGGHQHAPQIAASFITIMSRVNSVVVVAGAS